MVISFRVKICERGGKYMLRKNVNFLLNFYFHAGEKKHVKVN
jgi:hypothetical protein